MRSSDGQRWVGVGASCAPDGSRAGREALRHALVGEDPKLLVAFVSGDLDTEAFAAAVVREAGAVPLVGCSTAGEISTDGISDGGAVIVALGGPGFAVRTSLAVQASTDLRRAGADAAAGAVPERRAHRTMMLLSDGLSGDQQEVVRGAYSVTGAMIPLVGGCAGDQLRMRSTTQIYGVDVVTDAVVAVGLASDAPMGVAAHHGWSTVGEAMLVTAAEAARVVELDGRPALDVYLERLGLSDTVSESATAFAAIGLTHPLALARRGGEEVRGVVSADGRHRSITCSAEVPAGALVHLMQGDAMSVLGATDAACADAIDALDGADPIGLVVFDGVARRGVLGGEGAAREMEIMRSRGKGAPTGGFYTYGEFSRGVGLRGFHNQTLAVLALA